MDQELKKHLENKALKFRQDVLRMAIRANSGHVSTAFSEMEMLTALYLGKILNVKPEERKWPDRDIFILSKGQGGIGTYPILADMGFFPREELDRFLKPGGILGVHAEDTIPGIEVLTGSLGHGLGIATGMCDAARILKANWMVVCMTGDAELCEGSNWESMLTIATERYDNLVCVVDHNGQGTIGRLESREHSNDGPIQEPLDDKFRAFGFEVRRINGHDYEQIFDAFADFRDRAGKGPLVIISDTVKGKGAGIMERGEFFPSHYRLPFGDDLKSVLADLGMDAAEFKTDVGVSVGY